MKKDPFQESINCTFEENIEKNDTYKDNDEIIHTNKKRLNWKIFCIAIITVIIILIIIIPIIIANNSSICELKEVKDGKKLYICNFDNGDIYQGELKNGKRHGEGAYQWHDNTTYIGEWKENIQDDDGICIWNNGNIYMGKWKNGKMNGDGKFYYGKIF